MVSAWQRGMGAHRYDADKACPKCGHDKVATIFIEASPNDYEHRHGELRGWPMHEYLLRRCERCQFAWPERPVSAKRRAAAIPTAATGADAMPQDRKA